jgi:hypothetical protein
MKNSKTRGSWSHTDNEFPISGSWQDTLTVCLPAGVPIVSSAWIWYDSPRIWYYSARTSRHIRRFQGGGNGRLSGLYG